MVYKIGMAGLESKVALKMRDAGVGADRVIVTQGALRHMRIVHEPARVYSEAGPGMYNRVVDTDGKRIAVTELYRLPILESRMFDYGGNQEQRDPTVYPMTISHRWRMEPAERTTFDDYTSDSRSIEVTDGDNGTDEKITLKNALLACGIFMPEGTGEQDGVGYTEWGRLLIPILCTRQKSDEERRAQGDAARDTGASGAGLDDDDEDPEFDRNNADKPPYFGIRKPHDKPNTDGQKDEMYDRLKRSHNAYTLYLRAGILHEVVKLFQKLPNDKYAAFERILDKQKAIAAALLQGRSVPGATTGSARPFRPRGQDPATFNPAAMGLDDIFADPTFGPQGGGYSAPVQQQPSQTPSGNGSGSGSGSRFWQGSSTLGDGGKNEKSDWDITSSSWPDDDDKELPVASDTSSVRHVMSNDGSNIIWLKPQSETLVIPISSTGLGASPYRMLDANGAAPSGVDGYGTLLTAIQELRATASDETEMTDAVVHAMNTRVNLLSHVPGQRSFQQLFVENIASTGQLPILVANVIWALVVALTNERQVFAGDRTDDREDRQKDQLRALRDELGMWMRLLEAPDQKDTSNPSVKELRKHMNKLAGGGRGGKKGTNEELHEVKTLAFSLFQHLAETDKKGQDIQYDAAKAGTDDAFFESKIRSNVKALNKKLEDANKAEVEDSGAGAPGGGSAYAKFPYIAMFLDMPENAMPKISSEVNQAADLPWINTLCGEALRMSVSLKLNPLETLVLKRFVVNYLTRPATMDDKAKEVLVSARRITDAKAAIKFILKSRKDFVSPDEKTRMIEHVAKETKQVIRSKNRRHKRRRDSDSDDDSEIEEASDDDGDRGKSRRVTRYDDDRRSRALYKAGRSKKYKDSYDREEPERSWQEVKRMLYDMRISLEFCLELISQNIPFPASFTLLQMYVRLMVGSVVFLKAGAETAVMAINEAAILYARNADTFTVRVYARFSCGTFIVKSANLEFVPWTYAVAYRGGGGIRLYEPIMHLADFLAGSYPADVFVCINQYQHKHKNFLTEITGDMHQDLYSGRPGEWRTPTTHVYAHMWQWGRHQRTYAHPMSRQFYVEGDPRACTIAVQSSQRVWEPSSSGGAGSITFPIGGKGPLGRDVTSEDYGVIAGNNEFLGRGIEGSRSKLNYRTANPITARIR